LRRELFQPSREGEARLLLLISAFTTERGSLDGRTKLAKLDFLLRYPNYLQRALMIREGKAGTRRAPLLNEDTVESRMVRYRYGPWDPSYFALLGGLIGRGLVDSVPTPKGIAYRTTAKGKELAAALSKTEPWSDISSSCRLLRAKFDLSGTSLKKFIYEHFPEIVRADWGKQL